MVKAFLCLFWYSNLEIYIPIFLFFSSTRHISFRFVFSIFNRLSDYLFFLCWCCHRMINYWKRGQKGGFSTKILVWNTQKKIYSSIYEQTTKARVWMFEIFICSIGGKYETLGSSLICKVSFNLNIIFVWWFLAI